MTITEGEGRRVGAVLGLMFLAALVNYLDRFVLGALLPSIASDLRLSDAQLGFLNGGLFSLIAVFAAVPIGGLADRWSHRAVVALSLLTISLVTSFSTLATSFSVLAVARLIAGLAQSGITPAANAIIAQTIGPRRSASGLSVYALGLPAGILIGYLAGGLLADARGWRFALLVSAIPGVLLAGLLPFGLKRLPRPEFRGTKRSPMLMLCKRYLSRSDFLFICLGSAGFTMVWLSLLGWLPIYLVRRFGWTAGQAGSTLALIFGGSQLLGLLIGGLVGDRLKQSDARGYVFLCASASLGALPVLLFGFTTRTPGIAIALFFTALMIGLLQGAPALASIQGVADAENRALAVSLYLAIVTIIGGAGSQAVGLASGALEPSIGGAAALTKALMLITLVGCGMSTLFFRLAGRRVSAHGTFSSQKAIRTEP